MLKYVGITIGPIFDTICDASSPAAIWFASSLFSDITGRICEKVQNSMENVKIYSPYYSTDVASDDGVGKFHDRIIFSTTNYDGEKLKELLEQVKADTVHQLPEAVRDADCEQFFKEYLQIHFVVKDEAQIGETNCVLALSPYLDAMELMKTFPKDDSVNPIRRLFAGEEKNGNKYIKESPLFKRVVSEKNQLKKGNDRIWTIEEIASNHGKITESLKRKNYYAVVSADGDGMGKFLEQISGELVEDFSKACLEYDEAATALIGGYGGMTIYAGGDDVLFLAPVMTADGDVFGLCHKIQKLFREKVQACEAFKNMNTIPTISFGVSIQYVKYPLYEALDASRRLLALAKCDGDFANNVPGISCRKNNMLVEVKKHSGQSLALTVSNEQYDVLEKFLQIGTESEKEQEEKEQEKIGQAEKEQSEETILHSILYILDTFRSLIFVLNEEARRQPEFYARYEAAWDNLFDNAGQKKAKPYIHAVCKTYYDNLVMKENKGISVPTYGLTEGYVEQEDAGENADASLKTLLYILKLKQFLSEKEGEKE